MKRYIFLALIGAGMLGCEREDPAAALPPSPLAEAKAHLESASAGYVTESGFEGTLAEFQARELNRARQAFDRALSERAAQLSEVQMAAAAQAIASVDAERARQLVVEALDAWAQQISPLALVQGGGDGGQQRDATPPSGPVAIFAQMARLRALAETYGGEGATGLLTETNLDLSDERDRLQEHLSEVIKPLKDQADALRERIEQLRERQQKFSREAAELLDRAVDTTGEQRLDLYTRSMSRSSKADAAAGELDLAQAQLQRVRSDLAIAELEAERIRSRIQVMEGLVRQINTEQSTIRNEAGKAAQTANELQGRLVEMLNERAADHESRIADRFDRAAKHLEDAVGMLGDVRGRVSGEARHQLTLMQASKHTALGQTLRQALIADRAYAALASMVGDWARDNLASTVSARQTLIALSENANQRVSNVTERAITALQAAAEQLQEAKDELRDRDDRMTAQTLLVSAYQGLVALPTDADYANELTAARRELREMRE